MKQLFNWLTNKPKTEAPKVKVKFHGRSWFEGGTEAVSSFVTEVDNLESARKMLGVPVTDLDRQQGIIPVYFEVVKEEKDDEDLAQDMEQA
ncbi:hypothetical protein [Weissella tructae]